MARVQASAVRGTLLQVDGSVPCVPSAKTCPHPPPHPGQSGGYWACTPSCPAPSPCCGLHTPPYRDRPRCVGVWVWVGGGVAAAVAGGGQRLRFLFFGTWKPAIPSASPPPDALPPPPCPHVQKYFHTTDATLALWLDWGPVAFCITVLPALWLLHRRRTGLATSIRLGLSACTLAALLRLAPEAMSPTGRTSPTALAITHIAQVRAIYRRPACTGWVACADMARRH
jgi:hypothetical protein